MSIRLDESRINRYLPNDTFRVIKDVLKYDLPKDTNFYYLFNFPYIRSSDRGINLSPNERIQEFRWDSKFLNSILERRRRCIEDLLGSFHVREIKARCKWRFVVGLGASHPQETSMTLHHVYGIPYIPGSAIKGVTKHWVVMKLADKLKEGKVEDRIRKASSALESGNFDEIKKEDGFDDVELGKLVRIFGVQGRIGEVIFLDAYPIREVKLKLDVMSVHYPRYYAGGEAPADWQEPNIIKFLTVEDTKFDFCIISRDEGLLEIAEGYLKDALSEHGVGAKTSIGYGLFNFEDV